MTATARFDFDADEYYRVLREVWKFNPQRWLVPMFGILIPVGMLWLSVGRNWSRMSAVDIIANGTPWVLFGILYMVMTPAILRSIAKRAQQNEPSFRGPQERIVEGRGLRALGHGYSQELQWSEIVRAVETKEFFLFFYNRKAAHYLPKRALAESAIDDVRELLRVNGGAQRTRRLGQPA